MSGWRIALNELHALGGEASTKDFGDHETRRPLLVYGLAQVKRHGREYRYTITERGRMVVEGKLSIQRPPKRKRHEGYRWVPTWTAVLA